MKKLTFLVLIAFTIVMASCGSGKTTNEETPQTDSTLVQADSTLVQSDTTKSVQ